MNYVMTDKHREKISNTVHGTGQLPKAVKIALGTDGVNGSEIRVPLSSSNRLNNEVIRKEYTASEQVNSVCYEYALLLEANELVGEEISEMALIDSDDDLICIICFLPKVKDNIQEVYRIRTHY